ncbi:hypothetical protein KAT72_11560 [Aeromonas popoffii]|uniref:Uncharacterized protein n=1 Tax=Aeromonas popoffii TaxID=70856 RepID=A0ABS5GR74_9GAMM|nr:hypothetical protein [Aeromonas popoffii]MBR7629645.1 hypothetical protein [Aeromonas popoffii]
MTKAQQPASMDGKPSCFVIMPISAQPGYDSEHFTLVYDDIIKPAIELAGMKSIRADETTNTNLIQLDILRKVIESDIAICDMSAKNPNVFYELGVRQAFDKPTVLMIDEATSAPFDVSSLRYVTYSKGMRHRDVINAVNRLTETLKDTYSKREDKSEINSLIRLMELTSPAQLGHTDLSDEAKEKIIYELQLSEIMTSMHLIQRQQNSILNEMKQLRPSKEDIVGNDSSSISTSIAQTFLDYLGKDKAKEIEENINKKIKGTTFEIKTHSVG